MIPYPKGLLTVSESATTELLPSSRLDIDILVYIPLPYLCPVACDSRCIHTIPSSEIPAPFAPEVGNMPLNHRIVLVSEVAEHH